MIAVLFPRFDHEAIEERYASWQSQMLLRRGSEMEFALYDADEPASVAAGLVESDSVLVVTDPLIVPPPDLAKRLKDVLTRTPEAVAAVPVSNESANPQQKRMPAAPYLTLAELEQVMLRMQTSDVAPERLVWDRSDPGAYLCRTDFLDGIKELPRNALQGRQVVLSPADYAHRWIVMRAAVRTDLLPFIPADARSVLELGCGEGALGAAVKQRQKTRVVGVELDRHACATARKRLDDVYCGDVLEIVAIVRETFDCIVGSEIVEHVQDPWSLLADLRRIASPGGRLILSIPNIAHASVVGDLLRGRFDYAYIGLTCAGHVRFFTRQSIQELLQIAGWTLVEMVPQNLPAPDAEELTRKLESAGIPLAKEDLLATGYYVVARNPR